MTVYALYYDWYDESAIRGIYSEESMKAEFAKYVEIGRKANEAQIAKLEKSVEEKKTLRTQHKANKKDIERQISELTQKGSLSIDEALNLADLKKKLETIKRKLAIATRGMNKDNEDIKKLRALTDEQLGTKAMDEENLYFQEFEVQ